MARPEPASIFLQGTRRRSAWNADVVMSTSKLIAGLLGPTLIVSAISVITDLGAWPALVEDAARSPALIMIAGYIAFAPGLAGAGGARCHSQD